VTHGESNDAGERDIAVVGFAGRFPGARTVEQFWQNLIEARESITFFSDDELSKAGVAPEWLRDRNYVRAAPVLDDVDLFDAAFFGIPPREARLMDPQHRLFLECAWQALEHAGFSTETTGDRVGVFAGSALNTYFLSGRLFSNLHSDYVLTLTASDKDFLATRVAYKLDLSGPSMTVQTACSTSLVAIHTACQNLLARECDTALAGGVSVKVPQKAGYLYQEGGICTPDGHCRAFDAKAQGTIFGSGVGIVVLKRLSDALAASNTIHAIIKGSAVNNDGAAKVSYTAPSVDRQAEAVIEALANAQVNARTIGYVETHGTGTTLGDPIEIAALTRAFRVHTGDRRFCAIGSVKTNVGHLDAASGVTSLIKAVHVVRDGLIPPSLHFEAPNPEIDFAASPFFVSTCCARWADGPAPRRAGINALGVGGTNAHVIIEQPPAHQPSGPSRPCQLLLLSAKTSSALAARSSDLGAYLADHRNTDFADVAYTLQVGRRHLLHRRAVVAGSRDHAVTALQIPDRGQGMVARARQTEVAFMFSGQGEIHAGAGAELYRTEPTFRLVLDRCAEVLASELPCDLRKVLLAEADDLVAAAQLNCPRLSQPAAFAFDYSLAQLWMSWGVRPSALIGHSLGEFVAACLAGIFSLEDALGLIATRGRLTENLPPGAMLSVPLPEEELAGLLGSQLTIAALNGPRLCVVSGPVAAIEELGRALGTRNISARRLQVTHAFHSSMMDPLIDEFRPYVDRVARHAATIPLISTVTGNWMHATEAVDPGYWARHIRAPVRFSDGLRRLFGPSRTLLEVGPTSTLSVLAKRHPEGGSDHSVVASLQGSETGCSAEKVLEALGRLWLGGVDIDWSAFSAGERRRRIPLPTYPFQGQRHWIEASNAVADAGPARIVAEPVVSGNGATQASTSRTITIGEQRRNDAQPQTAVEAVVQAVWQDVLGIDQLRLDDNFFDLGGHSLLLMEMAARINRTFRIDLPQYALLEAPTIAALADRIERIYRPA
jgi:acyl transferase domain-containing protein